MVGGWLTRLKRDGGSTWKLGWLWDNLITTKEFTGVSVVEDTVTAVILYWRCKNPMLVVPRELYRSKGVHHDRVLRPDKSGEAS